MQEFESYSRKVEVLKENVKDMLMASKKDPAEHIEFINQLCRLGVHIILTTRLKTALKKFLMTFLIFLRSMTLISTLCHYYSEY